MTANLRLLPLMLLFSAPLFAQAALLPVKQFCHAAPLDAQVTSLYACFTEALTQLDEDGADLPDLPDSDAFFFEQLSDPNMPLATQDVETLCRDYFVAPLLHAAAIDRDAKENGAPHAQAMVGTVGYLGDNKLLGIAVKLGRLDHILGHSDITQRALWRLEGGVFHSSAADFLARAAQAPDLWLWTDPSAHALTPRSNRAPTGEDERRGQLLFLGHMQRLVERIHRAAKQKHYEKALVLMGVALHGAQDLVFHRGMTFDEHAGLAYYWGKNPDLPHEPDFSRAIEVATEVSGAFLRHIETVLGPELFRELGAAHLHSALPLSQRVREVFSEAHPIGFGEMFEYWLLSLNYRFGGAEREDELWAAARGRWPIADVTAAMVGDVSPSLVRALDILYEHAEPFLR